MKKLVFHESYLVDAGRGCWNWLHSKAGEYARFRQGYAHRFSYELYKGPISDGLVVDHVCRNTMRVNPDHLQIVTQKENIRLGFKRLGRVNGWWHKLKTHCPKGHEYSVENTYNNKKGSRVCRTCMRELMRERRAAA